MNTKIKKVIFDLDGVILSTDNYHYQSWKKLFKEEFNIDIDPKDRDLVRGISRADSLDALLKKYGFVNLPNEKKNRLLEIKNNYYIEYLEKINECDIYEGFRELSNTLKTAKMKMILASASNNAKFILEKLDIINLFDDIVDVTKLSKSKPNPEIFLEAAKLCGEDDPENCIVIEDAQAGIDGAKAAGMYVIAYNNSEQLLYNYDKEVKSHYEIVDMFNGK